MLQQGARGSSGHGEQLRWVRLLGLTTLQNALQINLSQLQKPNQLTARADGAQQPLRGR